MIKHTRLLFLLLFLRVGGIQAQNTHPPFWDDIQAFKKQDSIHPPPKNAILFVGSSSFTKWTSVQKDFPGYTIINRGFGGSTLPDVLRYEEDVIFKYDPKQIVIYCGDNDVASSDTITATTVLNRFKNLLSEIRAVYPNVPVAFVSIKPSPSREKIQAKVKQANKEIKAIILFCWYHS